MGMATYSLSRIISTMMRSSSKRLVRPTFLIVHSFRTDAWIQCSTVPVIMVGATALMARNVIMCVLFVYSQHLRPGDIITISLLA